MAHSYTSSLFHCIWSTKERRPFISPEIQDRLWPYLGGIVEEEQIQGVDRRRSRRSRSVLLSLPSKMDIAKAVQLIKGGSSKWIHDTFPNLSMFRWQEGYGAFSIGISHVDDTIRYIKNQAEHHRKRPFKEEYLAILEKHGIEYDPEHVLG